MRRLIPLLLVIFLALPTAAARRRSVAVPTPLAVPGIEAIAAEALTKVPGLSIAIRKGNAYYTNGSGEHDRTTHAPVRAESVFQIASLTKQFTGAAVAKLIEQGRVGIDDSVRRFIPELDGRFDPITIRHLLHHTSGIADHLGQIDTPFESKSQQEVLALIMSRPPYEPSGARWAYSNAGYYLLGMVIERAANMTYEQYLRTTFFEPLQLTNTSYCGTSGALPPGYGTSNGAFVDYRPMDMSLLFSAGSLCSTASDLVRWNRALVAGTVVSHTSLLAQSFPAYVGTEYGFGLYTDSFAGHPRIWHNGRIFGFQSHIAHFPDEDLTIVVLINWYALRDRASEIAEEVALAMLVPRN